MHSLHRLRLTVVWACRPVSSLLAFSLRVSFLPVSLHRSAFQFSFLRAFSLQAFFRQLSLYRGVLSFLWPNRRAQRYLFAGRRERDHQSAFSERWRTRSTDRDCK